MKDLRQFVAKYLELPEDLLLDLPRLTLVGDLQLLIENHRGIRAFSTQRVILQTTRGALEVLGSKLHIGAIDRDAIVITGQIACVRYQGSLL